MDEDKKLITIAEYGYDMEAHIAKLALEAEGIEAFVMGGLLLAACPEFGLPNIELQVKQKDAERAKQILAKKQPLDDSDNDEGDD